MYNATLIEMVASVIHAERLADAERRRLSDPPLDGQATKVGPASNEFHLRLIDALRTLSTLLAKIGS
jgi:hypothetical protein